MLVIEQGVREREMGVVSGGGAGGGGGGGGAAERINFMKKRRL